MLNVVYNITLLLLYLGEDSFECESLFGKLLMGLNVIIVLSESLSEEFIGLVWKLKGYLKCTRNFNYDDLVSFIVFSKLTGVINIL